MRDSTEKFAARAAEEGVMRILGRITACAVAGGMMLIFSNAGWSQQRNGPESVQNGGIGGAQNGGVGGLGSAQGIGRGSGPVGQTPSTSPLGPLTNDLPRSQQVEQEQAKMRNQDRQKRLMADTDKLLALANELKSQVEKSNKDTLSLDVVRKADEIEKLARSVKEKMKGS